LISGSTVLPNFTQSDLSVLLAKTRNWKRWTLRLMQSVLVGWKWVVHHRHYWIYGEEYPWLLARWKLLGEFYKMLLIQMSLLRQLNSPVILLNRDLNPRDPSSPWKEAHKSQLIDRLKLSIYLRMELSTQRMSSTCPKSDKARRVRRRKMMQIRKLDNDMLENGPPHPPNQTASKNSKLHPYKIWKVAYP